MSETRAFARMSWSSAASPRLFWASAIAAFPAASVTLAVLIPQPQQKPFAGCTWAACSSGSNTRFAYTSAAALLGAL